MISKAVWGELMRDFHEKELPELIERITEYSLRTPLKRAVVLTGVRKSGKTYSMFQAIKKLMAEGVAKKRILYINFEDSRLSDAAVSDLNNLLDVFFEIYPENKQEKTWFFLDEIQVVKNWEAFVRRLLDHENAYVFVTGSSSKMMGAEIATSLRGRSLTYRVFPFSFAEFLAARKIPAGKYLSASEKANVMNGLREYMNYGGYPEAAIYVQERERILREIIDVTVYKDIIERHAVKNSKVLRMLLTALFNSKEFSVHKFFNFLKSQGIKTSKNTLYAYFGYFCDSLVVRPLRKFSHSYKETEGSVPKVYFADNGLLYTQGIRDDGRLMENLVFTELERKWDKNLFYYKSIDGKEVDFVIKKGRSAGQLIQACYDLSDFNTKEREVKGLMKASNELGCQNLLIVTWDYEGVEKLDGKTIVCKPLCKWLLSSQTT